MSAGIQIDKDTATPLVNQIARQVTPQRLAAELGPRGTRLMQRNFRAQGKNKKGWPSTNFWGRAAVATNWQLGFGFVMIVANQIGIQQREKGGDIKPVNAGALTLPAAPDAYGKTAADFPNLVLKIIPDPDTGNMRAALVEKAGITKITKLGKVKKDGTRSVLRASTTTGLVALFWLAKSVHQEPDPGVIPSDAEWAQTMDQSADALMRGLN